MTNQPLLEVRDLQTVFELDEGTVKAVDGVSFDVYPGRVLGIVVHSIPPVCGQPKSVLRSAKRYQMQQHLYRAVVFIV